MAKFMIVDDIETNARLAKHLIEGHFKGAEVRCFVSGIGAIEELRQAEYDLILLDIQLPEVSGVDICRTIRQTNNKTPIVVVSAYPKDLYMETMLSSGANEYIEKPLSMHTFIGKIKKYVS